ncbi:MAG TPA: RcnB family protein [Ramlibacter sp.]|nr:RcnB family protein [Ramlibacter sp.]
MKRTLFAIAFAAVLGTPAFAQQVDNCSRSGYQEGVVGSGSEANHAPCDTRATPRVNGTPQSAPQATARPGYNREQQRNYNDAQRYNEAQRYNNAQRGYYSDRDPRYMGNRDHDWERYRDGNRYYGARGPEWRRGAHIPREYMARQYWVEDWRAHRLAAPPRGYQWVQVGNDYVMVAIATGIIAQLLLAQ